MLPVARLHNGLLLHVVLSASDRVDGGGLLPLVLSGRDSPTEMLEQQLSCPSHMGRLNATVTAAGLVVTLELPVASPGGWPKGTVEGDRRPSVRRE